MVYRKVICIAFLLVCICVPSLVLAQEQQNEATSARVVLKPIGSPPYDPDYLKREVSLRLPPNTNVLLATDELETSASDTIVDILTDASDATMWEIEVSLHREKSALLSRLEKISTKPDPVMAIAQFIAELLLSDPDYLLASPAPLPTPLPDLEKLPIVEEPPPPPEEKPEEKPVERKWLGAVELLGGGFFAGIENFGQGLIAIKGTAKHRAGLMLRLHLEYDLPATFYYKNQSFDFHSVPVLAEVGWALSIHESMRLVPFAFVGDRINIVEFRPVSGSNNITIDHAPAGGVGLDYQWHFREPFYLTAGARFELTLQQRHLLNNQEVFTTGTWRIAGTAGVGVEF